MGTRITSPGGHRTVIAYDNQVMTESAASLLRRASEAPFTRRAWAEVAHTVVSFFLAVAALAFAVPMLANGILWAVSADGLRAFGGAARLLARELLGEDIPAPPPIRPLLRTKVATPDHGSAVSLAKAAVAAGGKARQWESKPGVTLKWLPPERVTELAAGARVTITELRPPSEFGNSVGGRLYDPAAWRARGYFALKLPLAVAGLAVIASCWLGGAFFLTFPAWWALVPGLGVALGKASLASAFPLVPIGAAVLLAGPRLLHGLTETDRRLMRGLLGPGPSAARIRTLEQSRARAVDDSAARLRGIERDLHDGTQAQLVALAMKLGLAREKLQDDGGIDLARVTQLVEEAHRGALEAITDLRTMARGIHPPVLDNGLADALATLANRGAVPVELITDIPERPSAAIETIAYFSAAELLTNAAKHSGARHAHPARARRPRPDGRGPLEQRHRRSFRCIRARRREAHQQHLQQARPSPVGLRPPPCPGRAGLS
jgi:signal transduction histidine kinase